VTEDLGHKLEKVEMEMLGRAKKVTATKDDTILLDGGGEKSSIKAACDQLREEIKIATRASFRSAWQSFLVVWLS